MSAKYSIQEIQTISSNRRAVQGLKYSCEDGFDYYSDINSRLVKYGRTGSSFTLTSTEVNTSLGYTPLSNKLTLDHIFVGNSSNRATDVPMSGDATIVASGAVTLATVNANIGTFNSVTVNAKGLVTAASNVANSLDWILNGNAVSSEKWLGTSTNYDLPFRTNNTEWVRLLKTGEFGVGLTAPTAKTHIKGAGSTSATYALKIQDSSSNTWVTQRDDGQFAIGNGADNFYQMKIDTQAPFIGGLYINNGTKSGYALELYSNGGQGLYITTAATNNDAITIISGRSKFGGIVGIGSAAQAAYSLRVTSDGTFSSDAGIRVEGTATTGTRNGIDINMTTAGTQTQRGIYLDVSGGTNNYAMYINAGNIAIPNIPTGRGSVAIGDLYVDTAANILANGDLVLARKV